MIPPYGFYPCYRPCPACQGRLLSLTPLTRTFAQGVLHNLGISCFCERCNSRYRATSRLRYSWVTWMGAVGRWLWWQMSRLEPTTPPEG